jgi:hypothetical protein
LPETGTCRTCGMAIVWLRHERTQRKAPIEWDERVGGNVVADMLAGTYRIGRASELDRPLRVNHYSRCPQAQIWRERSAAREGRA